MIKLYCFINLSQFTINMNIYNYCILKHALVYEVYIHWPEKKIESRLSTSTCQQVQLLSV